jgi:light-regulated signal transduction histidine kinase (bacteriophytochrome)
VADKMAPDTLAQRYHTVVTPLSGLEATLGQHRQALSAGSWRPSADELAQTLLQLADQVVSARHALEELEQAQRNERRRLGHDMRVALNAIAGWAHILRLEKNPSDNVMRAADVLDRNVRTLTQVIESVHP